MELIDVLGFVAPRFTARWLWNRRLLQEASRAYDAARPSQFRPVMTNATSGDGVMDATGSRLRDIARQLDENHDLVVAILDDMVNNIIGAGVQAVPMVRTRDGKLATDVNDRLSDLFQQWGESPETTGDFGWEAAQRLLVLSHFRDGEVFIQHVDPNAGKSYRFRTRVPYAMELIEADLVPFDYQDPERNVLHGIENNAWNTPVAYYMLKTHPGDPLVTRASGLTEVKRVPAELIVHLKYVRRLRQRRGVTVLHAVLNRMRDLKDYEESERIAAKVAADFTWFIKTNSECQGPAFDSTVASNRTMEMSGGMGFRLQPGEDVGTINATRPNTGLEAFREAMLRAVAGGTGTRFSSISRNYNGTYSAQRQELVEGAVAYRAHFAYLVRRFYRPVYQRWLEAVMLTTNIRAGADIDPATINRVDFRAPALPWIDPAKEADAYQTLVDAGLESRQEIMRQRGRDPSKVWEEIEEERDSGLFASDVAAATDGGDLGTFSSKPPAGADPADEQVAA